MARAWKRVVGKRGLAKNEPFGPPDDQTLCRLRLVYHLERALGRTLELGAFREARRPSDFMSVLEALDRGPAPARPGLFLMPGMGGDDNYLLAFRAGLPRQLRVVVTRNPERPDPGAACAGFEAMVADVVAQITALAPEGPLRLAGFSLGGHVAYAASLRLLAAGRQIVRLGIIDSPRAPVPKWAPLWSPRRLIRFLAMARQGRTMESAANFTSKLIQRYRPGLIDTVVLRRRALPFDFGFHLRRAMMMDLQLKLLAPWLDAANADPVPVDVDAVLFRSEEHAAHDPEDVGWRRCCPRLRVVKLRGTHSTMFSAENLPAFQAAFIVEMGLDGA